MIFHLAAQALVRRAYAEPRDTFETNVMGAVNLLLANKTVKIEINQAAAEQAGLQISAKLLKLARLVKS